MYMNGLICTTIFLKYALFGEVEGQTEKRACPFWKILIGIGAWLARLQIQIIGIVVKIVGNWTSQSFW